MAILFGILFVLVCLLLVFMIVIQPSSGDGLAGAFGGMGSDTFFGTKAGQHINRFTMGLAIAFLILAVLINTVGSRPAAGKGKEDKSILNNEGNAPKPEQPTPPAVPSNP